ncbi:hypothetical protein B0H14DRAFT_2554251 [Mycena olivaceomarginata]|nr:hypothetical protein B0H14DRAFT_2554251 [Mycena olivaceomarginata]
MPVALLNAGGPIATLEEYVHRQWQRYAAGAPLDVEPTFSAAPQSEYYGSVILPNGQRLHRSAGFNVFRIFRDHGTGQPFTMSCHEFTFHVSTPDDPQRIWDLELCYPSDERLSAAMATLPSIEGQEPLSYPVHATKQAPPMIPLGHRVATGQGAFKVATADTVMMKSQTAVSPEELVEDPGSPLRGRARSPFSAIIMGPHAVWAQSRWMSTWASVNSASKFHPPVPWDCPLFGITESQKVHRSRESGTAVGSDTSAEKDSLAVNQEAEEVRQAFKDFTIAFDTPENENEQEFRSVVDMLEHEAAEGLRALAAGLRVEHAAVDELREIEDGLRRLETEEKTADPVWDDSPVRLLFFSAHNVPPVAFHFNPRVGDVIDRDTWSSSASASLESSSPEPLTPYDNDDHDVYRSGNENFTAEELEIRNFYESISPGDWSPAISDWSVEEFDLFPPFRPNPAHIIDLAIGRALNEHYLSGSRSPSDLDSDNSREDAEAAAELPQSDFSLRLGSRDHRSDLIRLELQSWTYECSAHRLTHLQHEDEMGSEPANAALPSLWTMLPWRQKASPDLRHPPSPPPYSVSLFVGTLSESPQGNSSPTSHDFSLPTTTQLPVSVERSTQADQIYEDEGSAGLHIGALESGGGVGMRDIEGEGSETRLKVGMKRKLSDGDAEEGMRKRKSPKTILNCEAVKATGLTDDKVVRLMAGVRLALLETGSRLEDLVWHRYGVTDVSTNGVWKLFRCSFPSCFLHHPLLFDLEVAKMQTLWSILQRNGHVYLADKLHELLSIQLRNEYVVSHVLNAGYLDFNYPEGEANYWDLLEDPDNVSNHHRTFSGNQVYENSSEAGEHTRLRMMRALMMNATILALGGVAAAEDVSPLPAPHLRTRGPMLWGSRSDLATKIRFGERGSERGMPIGNKMSRKKLPYPKMQLWK